MNKYLQSIADFEGISIGESEVNEVPYVVPVKIKSLDSINFQGFFNTAGADTGGASS